MKIHREQIIETAMFLLDRDGLEGVTVRKVATELQVYAGALYWHVKDKQELLDEMANSLLSEQFAHFEGPTPEQDWTDWLEETCLRLRKAMLAHREGARVVAGAGFGRAVLLAQLVESIMRNLQTAGFSLRQAYLICSATTSYVYGFVIEEQAAPDADAVSKIPSTNASMIAAVHKENQANNYTPETNFLEGLALILAGAKHTVRNQSS